MTIAVHLPYVILSFDVAGRLKLVVTFERFAALSSVFIVVLGSAMPVLAELYLPPMPTQVPVEVRVLQRHDSLLAFGLMLVLFIVVNLFSLLASASVGDSEDDFEPPYVFLSFWLTS